MTDLDARQHDPTLGGRASSRSPRQRKTTLERQASIAAWMFATPAALLLVLVFGAPLIRNIQMSFQDVSMTTFVKGNSPYNGLTNYRTVINDPGFRKLLTNTALFTVGSIVCQFGIGLAMALFFVKRFPLNAVLRGLVLLPWLLPLLVSTTTWRWMMDADSGILNRALLNANVVSQPVPWLASTTHALWAVLIVNIWVGIPFNMTLLYGGLKEIPQELKEAAAIDGAGPFRTFRHITWPLLSPVVAVVLVLGVVYTIKVIDIIVVLTNGGPAEATQTVASQSFFYSFRDFEFGLGAATSNILILLSLVFSMIYLWLNRKAVEAQ